MARPIVLSNGELHVGLNKWGLVHDFYFPYVGLENHSAGKSLRHKIGIWADGRLSWLDGGDWEIISRYPHSALIGYTTAKNEKLGLVLEFNDLVDAHINALIRNIHIINLREDKREVRLFMHQAFTIGDSRSNTDTAQYLPSSDALLHYRGRRAFVISGEHQGKSFDQHTVGLFGIEGREGTFRDAEDGELSFGNIDHGQVDSTIRFMVSLDPYSSDRINYWIAAGASTREALYVHKELQQQGIQRRIDKTADWWHKWLEPAYQVVEKLPSGHRSSFIRSMMLIKSQIDKRGAIIASTDTTLLNYSRDAYGYCWPRDGSLVIWPLIRLGYVNEPRCYFEFCKRVLTPEGYLMHKYRADGALGSSWHPYIHSHGIVGAPIQEDETALTLFSFAQFYHKQKDTRLLQDFYDSMIVPMANFLTDYVDRGTGLPKPSYDLWEEVYLTTTFSVGATYGALVAASELAAEADDNKNAVKWRAAADDIQLAAHKYLFNESRQAFYKGVIPLKGKIVERDGTIDMSSIFGAFMFGLFAIDSDQVTNAVITAKQTFNFDIERPGLPRYENDNYHRVSDKVTGNWWFITSLWLAQYELEIGNQPAAVQILNWTKKLMLPSGVLAEQINPLTDETISPSPLTWSHAEYIATLLDMITEVDDTQNN